MEKIPTTGEWTEIEEKVNEAEKVKRQSTISKIRGKAIETDIEKSKTEALSDRKKKAIEKLTGKMKGTHQVRSEALDSKLKELIGEPNENSNENGLISLRYSNLRGALEEDIKLDEDIEESFEEEQILLKTIGDIQERGETAGKDYLEALGSIRDSIDRDEHLKEILIKSSPEAYYGLHLKELKKYKNDIDSGVIVETPYVKKQAEKIVSELSSGHPVFIYGHLGSGKTEIAMHVARNYILKDRPDLDEQIDSDLDKWKKENPKLTKPEEEYKRKEFEKIHKGAVVISGSKFLSLSEFYGHQVLKLDKNSEGEAKKLVEKVDTEFKAWEKKNSEATEEEKDRVHNSMVAAFIQNKSGTVSDFYLGPVYKAMEEGRPVIIDEVNAIQHEVLISLNHILTRRTGDIVPVQQDSGRQITVKEGFCVIMTGNLNTRKDVETYTDRKELDPAFLSRLYQIEHNYLPQRTDGVLENDAGPDNELFQIMLSMVMDKSGNIELPKDEIRKLWNLALATKETQEVFSGKLSRKFKQGGSTSLPASDILKKNVASIRAVNKIVTSWQKSGMEFELDYYVWDKYISNASDSMERALLYQMFREKGFFGSDGWDKKEGGYGSGGKLDSFEINAPKNRVREHEFFGARESVDFAFGKGPERTRWPEFKEKANSEKPDSKKIDIEELQKMSDENSEVSKKLKGLSDKIKKVK